MSKLKSSATLNVRYKTVGRRIFLFTSSKQYYVSDLFKDAWHLQGVCVKCHQETPHVTGNCGPDILWIKIVFTKAAGRVL